MKTLLKIIEIYWQSFKKEGKIKSTGNSLKYTCQNLECTGIIKTIQMMVNWKSVKILK